MGTIPLPALDVRPPAAPPNMLEQYGQLMSLRNQQQEMQQRQALAPLQQQAAQQQVQSGALDVQAKQRDMASQNAMMQSFAKQDPTDPRYFQNGIRAAQATGQVLPQHLQAAMNMGVEFAGKLATQNKTQLEIAQQVGDSLHSLGTQLLQMPEAALQQQWPVIKQKILSTEGLDKSQAPDAVPDEYPGMQWIQAHTAIAGMSAAGARAAAQQQEADIAKQRLANEQPGQIANSDSLVLKNAAQQLAASPDQATYQAALGELPMKVAKNFPAQFDQQKVLQVGMTPAEVVTSQATAAQRQETNSFRQQALSLQAQNAQNTQAVRQQTEDAKGRKWVMGTDASGNMVAGPVSQLQSAGIQNLAELGAPEVKDIMNARHTINIATKVGDPSKPETMGTLQLIDSLDKDGKLGALASRYNKFVTTGVGASPGDDPRIVTLIDKNMLQDTGAMLAHFGASGGRSPQMLQHFLDLSNAGKMDGVTLRAGTKAIVDYMRDRAMMPAQAGGPPSQGGKQPTQQGPTTRPPGATHIVPGPDGKNHYTNATGTVDYGVAP